MTPPRITVRQSCLTLQRQAPHGVDPLPLTTQARLQELEALAANQALRQACAEVKRDGLEVRADALELRAQTLAACGGARASLGTRTAQVPSLETLADLLVATEDAESRVAGTRAGVALLAPFERRAARLGKVVEAADTGVLALLSRAVGNRDGSRARAANDVVHARCTAGDMPTEAARDELLNVRDVLEAGLDAHKAAALAGAVRPRPTAAFERALSRLRPAA
jgi:hypothetical protein